VNNASYTLHHSARLLDPIHVGLPREVHVVVRQLIVILQWLAPMWLQFLHLRQLFARVDIQRTYFVIAENIWRTMNQVPRVNTQIDYGRNSSKRIGDTVHSLQRHKSITQLASRKSAVHGPDTWSARQMWYRHVSSYSFWETSNRGTSTVSSNPFSGRESWRTSNRLLLCTAK